MTRRWPVAAAGAVALLIVAACGSGDPDEAAPTTPPPATTSAPSEAPQSTGTPTSTAETTVPAPGADDRAATLCAATDTATLGEVASDDLIEASGLVASRINSGVLWSHNDSGSDAGVFAIDSDGRDLGFFPLIDVDGFDVEDIAIGRSGDGFDLFLGDIGDNFEQRETITVYRFTEPDPGGQGVAVTDVEVLEFRYPDRPHNAEVLLFDEADDRLVIVTKEQVSDSDPPDGSGPTAPSLVFAGTVDGHGNGPIELVAAGTIDTPTLETMTGGLIPHPLSVLGFGGVPTGGDVAADGSLVAIRTYETVWIWPRRPDQTVAEAFTNEPCEATPAFEIQGEAVALTDTGFVTLGEGDNQPLNRVSNLDDLVIDRRPMSDAEYDRIDDDGAGGVLDCDRLGATFWDYGPIGPEDPTDRVADDALLDAIADLNADRQGVVPVRGWVELIEGDGRSTFLLEIDGDWRALVTVNGDPAVGVWRHNDALVCQP